MLKAAINGNRNSDHHPRLPFSAEQAALEGLRCVEAGADAIHVHVWNNQVKLEESLAPDDVADFLSEIRKLIPNTPVGISTGAWIVPNFGERLELIKAWEVLPDFVSLNVDEDGFEQVAEILLDKAIGIEAGIFDSDAASIFASWKNREQCLRVMLEPNEISIQAAINTVEAIETILNKSESTLPRLLHGLDNTTWAMLELAAKRGYDTRIGFEDTTILPNKTIAESNSELVKAAIQIVER